MQTTQHVLKLCGWIDGWMDLSLTFCDIFFAYILCRDCVVTANVTEVIDFSKKKKKKKFKKKETKQQHFLLLNKRHTKVHFISLHFNSIVDLT